MSKLGTQGYCEMAGGVYSNPGYTPFHVGLKNAPDDLYIAGKSVVCSAKYVGTSAAATEWPGVYGETLSLVSNGTDVDLQQDVSWDSSVDKCVQFNQGDFYRAGTAAAGSVGTDDFVMRLVFKNGTNATSRYIVCKYEDSPFWAFYVNGTGLSFAFNDGTGNIFFSLGTVADGDWADVMLFCKRGSGVAAYVNGANEVTRAAPSNSLDDTGARLSIGAYQSGIVPVNASVALFQCWNSTAWLDSHQQLGVAAHCYYLLTGTRV